MIDDPLDHLRYAAPELLAQGFGLRCLWDERFYPSRPTTHTREQAEQITALLRAAYERHILHMEEGKP